MRGRADGIRGIDTAVNRRLHGSAFLAMGIVADGEELLRAFHSPDVLDFDARKREAAQRRLRLGAYHFVMSVGSLAKFLHKAAPEFPDIRQPYDAAEHLRTEGQYLRNMIEHADVNLRAKSIRGGFVREGDLLNELPGDRPGAADSTSYIVDSNGHWLGGRLNVEKVLAEVRAIYEATENIPRWPPVDATAKP